MANYVSKENLSYFKLKQDTYNEKKFVQPSALTNLATKDEVSAIPKYATAVVDALPTTDISSSTIYLVKTGDADQNLYTEYIYVNNKWEELGTQALDLTGYTQDKDLATVAKSGKYSDLTGTPDSLKNPAAITFTGGATGSYDGSEAKEIAIPSYSTMTGATADAAGKEGLVPAAVAGQQGTFLRADGTWAAPANTEYSEATSKAAGLMSAADKTKLDGIGALSETDIDAMFTES